MVDDLRNGGTLSEAAGKHPEAFPNYYIGHPAVGRAHRQPRRDAREPGRLPRARARDTSRRSSRRCRIPGVVMVMAMFTVVVLAGYVLPQFKPLFEELDADLPLTTRMLLFVATLFTTLWYIPVSCFSCVRRRHVLAVQDRQRKTGQGQAGPEDPGHQGHRRVRDPRALLPHPRRRWSRPACRCPRA